VVDRTGVEVREFECVCPRQQVELLDVLLHLAARDVEPLGTVAISLVVELVEVVDGEQRDRVTHTALVVRHAAERLDQLVHPRECGDTVANVVHQRLVGLPELDALCCLEPPAGVDETRSDLVFERLQYALLDGPVSRLSGGLVTVIVEKHTDVIAESPACRFVRRVVGRVLWRVAVAEVAQCR